MTELAHRLAALHYAVPSFSSTFSYDFVESVYAFQKVQGLERTGIGRRRPSGRSWRARGSRRPRYASPADHIEVDKTHQVLYLVRDGQIALISPVSTAGHRRLLHARGTVRDLPKVAGYDPSPLGVLLDPMYFVGGYAIHGQPVRAAVPGLARLRPGPELRDLPAVRLRAVRRNGLRLLVGARPGN